MLNRFPINFLKNGFRVSFLILTLLSGCNHGLPDTAQSTSESGNTTDAKSDAKSNAQDDASQTTKKSDTKTQPSAQDNALFLEALNKAVAARDCLGLLELSKQPSDEDWLLYSEIKSICDDHIDHLRMKDTDEYYDLRQKFIDYQISSQRNMNFLLTRIELVWSTAFKNLAYWNLPPKFPVPSCDDPSMDRYFNNLKKALTLIRGYGDGIEHHIDLQNILTKLKNDLTKKYQVCTAKLQILDEYIAKARLPRP